MKRLAGKRVKPCLELTLAVFCNLSTKYFLKAASGFTVLLPTVLVLFFISITLVFLSRAMRDGIDTAMAMTFIVVTAMLGSSTIGVVFFHEYLSWYTMTGLGIAILGTGIASMAKTPEVTA